MTSKSLNSQTNPFLLKPAAKDYLWGGNRLNEDFYKNIDMSPLAETWECSTHPDGPSIVASGDFEGKTLIDVIKKHPEFLGSHPKTQGELPILVKLIDAKKDLSVQVHPTDEYAREFENGQLGKTEVWYVLDAPKGSTLVHGLSRTCSKEEIKESIENGTLEKYLQKVDINKNDLFFIEAGTIHAIGAGALVAEIQESSNLTYRLYDYDRVDKNGKKRELHVEKALKVANLNSMAEPTQPMRVLNYKPGYASELLCRCRYFEVHRVLINSEFSSAPISYKTDELSFCVLLCIEGNGELIISKDDHLLYKKGDCIFVPANSAEFEITGKSQILDIRG